MTHVYEHRHHPREAISAYADGELTAEEEARVEAHLTHCTECARELALIRAMGQAMSQTARSTTAQPGVWQQVHRRITQPIGWLLASAGVATWVALALVEWFRSRSLTPEWLATTAVGIGVALIAVAVGYEQLREWRDSPYKDIER
ncbi:MAG TPA: zf-HC2 domain-containing protein [Gemmatimonadaceae bacterium]|nr:zf-HC2 domain-containing protein [Gemmatimonadaceae bacterium]